MSDDSALSPALVRVSRAGGVTILSLDHPPVNVLSKALLDELRTRIEEIGADPETRVVILDSACERAFAAGADIREMAQMGTTEAEAHGARGQGVTTAIEDLAVPVIASVHGSCLGGGTEIALACDFIIASNDAVFGQPEIRLGVMPGWGGTVRLPSRVGIAVAREWIYTGRTVPASEAASSGLVDRIVPRSELQAATLTLAETMASQPPEALAAAKRALRMASQPGRDSILRAERRAWSELFGTPDQREGMEAFLGRRSPRFSGRPRSLKVSGTGGARRRSRK